MPTVLSGLDLSFIHLCWLLHAVAEQPLICPVYFVATGLWGATPAWKGTLRQA